MSGAAEQPRATSIRTRLLVVAAAPVLVTGAILSGLFLWGHTVQVRAYEEALAWARHTKALRDLDWAARFYVDSVADKTVADPFTHEAESRQALTRARAEAEALAPRFSAEDQAGQARLDQQLNELVEAGQRVGSDRGRLAALQTRYRDHVDRTIRRRIEEEAAGSARALQAAKDLSRDVRFGGLAVAFVALLAAVTASVVGVRRFGQRVAALERAAARVAAGDLEQEVPATSSDELGRLAGSLNSMVDALRRQRTRQLGFLAAVAHDLRNPLAAMRYTTETLLQPGGLPAEPTLRKSLGLIDRQVDRLARMANDLVDAASIEAGQLDLRALPCDLTALARDVVDLYAGTAPVHQLTLSAPAEPVMVTCDPTRIAQVLDNLVSNAIKYSPEGGPVNVAVAADANEVVVSVADTGMGIPAGAAEVIFEPFRRGVASRAAISGLGLGLWICRRVAVAHRGSLTVASEPGLGARFELRVPRAAAAATASSAAAPGA